MTALDPIRVVERWLASLSTEYEYDQHFALVALENPGWILHASDLHEELYGVTVSLRRVERSESDWVFWRIDDGELMVACGPENLHELLAITARLISEGSAALPRD